MSKIGREIGMDRRRLSALFKRYKQDPTYNPKNATWGGCNRAFSIEEETKIVATLMDDLAPAGYALPRLRVRKIFYDHYKAKFPRTTRRHSFSASKAWAYDLFQRHNLSSRKTQKQRKQPFDTTAVKIFRQEMKKIRKEYDRALVFNSDETPIRVSPQSIYTSARVGRETPHAYAQPGHKEVITALATVSSDGKAWPLTIVAKGRSPVCVRHLDMPEEIHREFTPSGKTNEDVCMRHVQRISEFAKGEPCCLIWDSYGAHWTEKVKSEAARRNVRMECIPKNATHILQPLDTTIFPVVSSKHQARLLMEEHWSNSLLEAKKKAVQSYNLAWKKVQRRTVKKAFTKMVAG